MTAAEWLRIAATITDRWPSSAIPEATIAQWGNDLADLEGQAVMAAVDALYREGREFAPNGGQIRAKLVDLILDAPDWAEALRQLRQIERTPIERAVIDQDGYENGDSEEPDIRYVYPRAPVLRASHPLVISFRDHVGEEGLGAVLSPDAGGSDEARARVKWDSFVHRAGDVVRLQGIPDGGLRKLRRIQGPGELRKLGFTEHVAELEPADEAAA